MKGCTERCRRAAPGTCCCSCEGANHGEAAPIQQKRLALSAGLVSQALLDTINPHIEIHAETCGYEACRSEPAFNLLAGRALAEDAAYLTLAPMTPQVAAMFDAAGHRVPHDRTILGRTVHLSPGYRYTLDSEEGEPIWFAYFGARHESAVDPDVAARKALGLHGAPA